MVIFTLILALVFAILAVIFALENPVIVTMSSPHHCARPR